MQSFFQGLFSNTGHFGKKHFKNFVQGIWIKEFTYTLRNANCNFEKCSKIPKNEKIRVNFFNLNQLLWYSKYIPYSILSMLSVLITSYRTWCKVHQLCSNICTVAPLGMILAFFLNIDLKWNMYPFSYVVFFVCILIWYKRRTLYPVKRWEIPLTLQSQHLFDVTIFKQNFFKAGN